MHFVTERHLINNGRLLHDAPDLKSNLRCPFWLKNSSIYLQLNFDISMSKRKLDHVLALPMPSARSQIDLTAVRQELIAVCRSSKSSLSRTLHALRRMDLLRSDVDIGESEQLERVALGRANQVHAKAQTTYGPVVQFMQLPGSDLQQFEYVSPAAFLNYLSCMCDEFSDVLEATYFPNNAATLILYGDEMTPGNPLRADGGRELLNFYYTLLELPTFMHHRKDGWFVLASLRSSLIDDITGGVSGLLTRIMRTLFADDCTHSLSKGIF